MAHDSPPSYLDAISHSTNTRLATRHPYGLVLDGRHIYPAAPPSQFLYEISSPPRGGLTPSLSIHKWRFRLSDHQGEGTLRSRLDPIYDVQHLAPHPDSLLRPAVRLDGKAGNRLTHREVVLLGGRTGWSTCAAAEGWFRADVPLGERVRDGGGRISWRSRDGVLVAVETRAGRKGRRGRSTSSRGGKGDGGSGGDAEALPRLDIRGVLAEKELDLLVACWVARVWKEARAEERGVRRWKEVKKIARCTTRWNGSSLGGRGGRSCAC